jgi:hypothetical protein
MGSISFLLPSPMPAAPPGPARGPFFAHGYEQAVTAAAVEAADGLLRVTKPLDDSGYLLAPWPVGPFGTLVAGTSTLRERAEPYRLMLELARGKLNQVRTQAAEWQGIGLVTPKAFDARVADATRQFGKALVSPPAESDAHAARVLEESFALADVLAREFVSQLFDTRHQEEGKIDARLAARSLGGPGALAGEYARAFNAAAVGLRWAEVEPEESRYDWSAADRAVAAAKAADLPITMGPVIDLAPGMLPAWAAGWEGDLPTLAAFTCDFLETAVRRYKADVRRWVVCGGFNHADALGLGGDERVRLAFRLFEAAQQLDPHLELVLSVSQPWGEYLGTAGQALSPLAFPDDLIRAGLKVAGVELEIRPGVTPRGSLPRDLLDTVRLLHLFGSLGVPLELTLSLPSSPRPDPAAVPGQAVWGPAWRAGPSPDGQAEWGASFAALGLSIPHVRAVTWDHWADSEFHLTPAGGLVGTDGRPKPLLSRLRSLRASHLD